MSRTPSQAPSTVSSLTVRKRNGLLEPFDADKVRKRISRLCDDLPHIDVLLLVRKVEQGVTEALSSVRLDELVAQVAAYHVTMHPNYGLLGGRLAVTALHKDTSDRVVDVFRTLRQNVCAMTKRVSPLVDADVWDVVQRREEELQRMVQYSRDLSYEFFGFKTLEKSYLLRVERNRTMVVVERPQHMLIRVAIGIHGDDMDRVRETYDLMSRGVFTHATPTLFNAGTPQPQMSSCFLVAMRDDSIDGIYDTLKQCARISKSAGGIGMHVHNIRCTGSYIAGTNGTSNGLVPLLRVWNNTARYVDQGGGKRKGAFAIYLEPWHGDVMEFLHLKRNTGAEEIRARDLFYAMWIPDLFMKRVAANGLWTLMDPRTAPGLSDVSGDAFDALYEQYEREGRGVRTMPAQELWFTLLESQIETGTPYMLYKDACNAKSNQRHLGTIKCSNLCTEIVEYTSSDEVAVCNLASIALPRFVVDGAFDHRRLREVTHVVVRNLNRVIDKNYYPVEEARKSNMRHRPIGIGVQGLADTFIMLRMPFASPPAQKLNEEIFETIYYAAVEASCDLADIDGAYESFPGSPASQGLLQFDLWNAKPTSGRWDWDALKRRVVRGMRNSLLVAPMPTASTSQILGNNECFEPFTSNLYVRRVLSGEFPIINKYLVLDLIRLGLWNESVRNQIIAHNGSVQKIASIPADIRELYKVVWEIRQKDIIDMAAARAKYIDQSQSLNLFLEAPRVSQLTSMHFYAWRLGLKTGMYYLRSRAAADAVKVTVDLEKLRKAESQGEGCLNCGS